MRGYFARCNGREERKRNRAPASAVPVFGEPAAANDADRVRGFPGNSLKTNTYIFPSRES